jgi:hypothetical protein
LEEACSTGGRTRLRRATSSLGCLVAEGNHSLRGSIPLLAPNGNPAAKEIPMERDQPLVLFVLTGLGLGSLLAGMAVGHLIAALATGAL